MTETPSSSGVASSLPDRREVWLTLYWPAFVFFLAATAIRLQWNLEIHPIGDFIYSDMRGYMDRANGIFDDRWGVREYNAFYPYGTHVLLYAIMRVFGQGNYPAIGVVYAVLGGLLVAYSYGLATLVSRWRVVHLATGALLVCYYPLISLGGYFLSEVPFSLCMVVATAHLLRLVRHGRNIDAWVVGVFVSLAFTLRPQILASCVIIGVLWLLLRRGAMKKVKLVHWAQTFVPLLLIMAFSSWRLHHHTERYGLISENGKFNQVYGRCHVEKITAIPDRPPRRRTSFGPPAMIQLKKRDVRNPGEWPQLEPALELHYQYRGYIGDSEILGEYIDRCIEKTGWAKQVEYAVVDVLLLWRYNVMWPDSGKAAWQPRVRKWGSFTKNVLAIPALLGMLALFVPRKATAMALVSSHLWALHIVAAIYIGGVRFRAPYDPLVILMAFEVVAFAAVWVWGHVKRRLAA
jgi:hypothetical protein